MTSSGRLLQVVTDEKIFDEAVTKLSIRAKRLTRYRNKALDGQFLKGTEEMRDQDSWDWLKSGQESFRFFLYCTAAQDQEVRTNSIKNRIDKKDLSPICRLYGEREETIIVM